MTGFEEDAITIAQLAGAIPRNERLVIPHEIALDDDVAARLVVVGPIAEGRNAGAGMAVVALAVHMPDGGGERRDGEGQTEGGDAKTLATGLGTERAIAGKELFHDLKFRTERWLGVVEWCGWN